MTERCSSHHWHQSDWPRSVSEPALAATFPALSLSLSLSHTHRTLFYLSGCCLLFVWLGSPAACLPAHHINPIMLHCPSCSSAGLLPSGKRGEREKEEREGESEEKRKVTRGHGEAGTMKSGSGLQDAEQGRLLYSETRNQTAPTKSKFWFESVTTTTLEINLKHYA